MKTVHSIFIALFLITFSSVAQNADSTKSTPAQITFAYPISRVTDQNLKTFQTTSLSIFFTE